MDRYPERVTRPTLNTPERKEEEMAVREPVAVRKPQPTRPASKEEKKYGMKALLGLIGIVVLLGAFWWFIGRNFGIPSYIDTSKYQIVTLQTGELYFGKVIAITSDTVQIKNVFYVQKAAADSATTSSSANNLELIKLGKEVHGPEDMMVINRSNVSYIENLKPDGKVTQTINSYYQQNK